ncbi:hypothetical protein SAMN04515668_4818 [Hymenobacter arizonensis]|uniref:Uncharacterized protein n=1 Tax=Hymenobacter arizonensis TaxID=1227077 RepID=A0A1I6BND9_HYMAR|nr:hypothetical protein SAMN04515668_4818 [Hymenobacter arizonensis]
MKIRAPLITIIAAVLVLFTPSVDAIGQGSYGYSVSFKLVDSRGNEINRDGYVKAGITLYANNYGDAPLTYSRSTNTFCVSLGSISASNPLVFATGTDTTVVTVTRDIHIKDLQLLPGYFNLSIGQDEKLFACSSTSTGTQCYNPCYNKRPFKTYRARKRRYSSARLGRLTEVKLGEVTD